MARSALPVSPPDETEAPERWTPQPGPQEQAIRASFVTELFFGGARGGGKTDYLLGDFAADVGVGHKNHWRGILFRRTYPELDEIVERSKQIYYGAFPGAEYKVGQKMWVFPDGEQLRLRHIENEDDADHYQGHSYAWIGHDELTQWPTLKAYHKLKACLRAGGKRIKHKRIRATGNPGGPGHQVVKQYFIDVAEPGTLFKTPRERATRMFVPSRVFDNRILLENDPAYIDRLQGVGDAALVKAWLEGDWEVFVGQYFAQWRNDEIEVPSFAIPTHWPLFGAMDYGEAAPTSFGLYTVDFDHVVYRIAEYYQAGRAASQHAQSIMEMIRNCPFTGGRVPTTVYVDPSMFVKRRLSEIVQTSPADVFAEHGLYLTAATNDRITGWRVINDALIKQRFKTFRGWNDALMRTVPALPRSTKNPEDLDTEAEDHAADELRYAMLHIYKPAQQVARPNRDPFLGANVLKELPGARRRKGRYVA